MPRLAPIPYQLFEKFLVTQGYAHARTKGDHRMWIKKGSLRPIVVRLLKDLPIFEIRCNLRTMGVSVEAFLEWLKNR